MGNRQVLAVGPPGVGKSRLLNTLLGKDVFESGPAVTGGLTKNVQVEEGKLFGEEEETQLRVFDVIKYANLPKVFDTPGFGDPELLPETIIK